MTELMEDSCCLHVQLLRPVLKFQMVLNSVYSLYLKMLFFLGYKTFLIFIIFFFLHFTLWINWWLKDESKTVGSTSCEGEVAS